MSTRRSSLDRLAAESTQSRAVANGRDDSRARGVPTLTIAWHPDVERIGERVALVELAAADRDRPSIDLSRLTPRFAAADTEPFPLADRFLSRRPIRLTVGREPGSVRLDASDSGLGIEVDGEALAGGAVTIDGERLRRGVTLMLSGRVVLILHTTRGLVPASTPDFGLVGDSDGLRRVRAEIARVAALDIPVLIRGATGTG
ncbi:MAG: sigma-54-dependent Fis family transcriptional regulator, partial [Acidobacteriota bacterium]